MSRTMLQIVNKIKKLVEIDQHAIVEYCFKDTFTYKKDGEKVCKNLSKSGL